MENHLHGHLKGDAPHLTEGEPEAQRGCDLCRKLFFEFCRARARIQSFGFFAFPPSERTKGILLLADEIVGKIAFIFILFYFKAICRSQCCLPGLCMP